VLVDFAGASSSVVSSLIGQLGEHVVRHCFFVQATWLAVLLAGSAEAGVLLDESFNYNNGGLANNSGGNWSVYSGGGGNVLNVSGGAAIVAPGSSTREDALRSFTASNITTGSVYLSFNFKVNTAPTTGSEYFLGLFPATSIGDPRGKIFISQPATPASGRFRIALSNELGASAFTGNLTTGTQYVGLLAVDAATNSSRLWVGTDENLFAPNAPTLLDSTSVSAAVGLARLFLRQGNQAAASIAVDNIRVGTAFSDFVTTAVPEASSFLILGAMGAAVGARRAARRVYRAG
jgi:hypothetical protein